jgi:hypothetical protein
MDLDPCAHTAHSLGGKADPKQVVRLQSGQSIAEKKAGSSGHGT